MHTILKGALPAKREAPPVIQPTQLQVLGLAVADSLPFLWNRSVQSPSERGMEVAGVRFSAGRSWDPEGHGGGLAQYPNHITTVTGFILRLDMQWK